MFKMKDRGGERERERERESERENLYTTIMILVQKG
jgi:hypothetical protein